MKRKGGAPSSMRADARKTATEEQESFSELDGSRVSGGSSSASSFDSSSSADETGGSQDGEEDIDVAFEFGTPVEADFHSVKALLQQLFAQDAEMVGLSAVADAVVSDPLSVIVKAGNENEEDEGTANDDKEDEDGAADGSCLAVCAVVTDASVGKYLAEVARKAPADSRRVLERALAGSWALVVNERLINMPMEVGTGLYDLILRNMDNQKAKRPETIIEVCKRVSFGAKPVAKKAKGSAVAAETVFLLRPELESLRGGGGGGVTIPFALLNAHKVPDAKARRVFSAEGCEISHDLLVLPFAEWERAARSLSGGMTW